MKNIHWITFGLLAIALAGLSLVHASEAEGAPPSNQGQAGVATGSGETAHLRGVSHGDGVRSEIEVKTSRILTDDASGERVKCISFLLIFSGSEGTLLSRAFGQRTVGVDSDEVISFPLSGLDPALHSASAETPGPHAYSVSISPAMDSTWGATEESAVLTSVVRTE